MFNSRRRESASSSESRQGRILSIRETPVLDCLNGVVARVVSKAGLPHSQARLPKAHERFRIICHLLSIKLHRYEQRKPTRLSRERMEMSGMDGICDRG